MLGVGNDRDMIQRWYQSQVQQFGYDHRGLGFNQQTSQLRRFEVLWHLGSFDGARLLDVGCGFGDFLAWLLERGVQPRYTGLDLCPQMVEHCRTRFASAPELANAFAQADVLEYQPDEPFDYVVASSIFGLRSEGAVERIAPTLERLFSWCRIGLAVNFLSDRAPTQAERNLYVSPSALLCRALELTPAVRLRHDYMPDDFTLFLYREPSWRPRDDAQRARPEA